MTASTLVDVGYRRWNGVVGTGSTLTAVPHVNNTFTVNNPGGVSASINGTTLTYSISLSGTITYGFRLAVPDTRAGAPAFAQVLGPTTQYTTEPSGSYTAFANIRWTIPGAPLAQVLGAPQARTAAPTGGYAATVRVMYRAAGVPSAYMLGTAQPRTTTASESYAASVIVSYIQAAGAGVYIPPRSEYRPVNPPLAAPAVVVNRDSGGEGAFTVSLNLTGAVTYQKRSVNAGGDELLPPANVTVPEAVRYQAQVAVYFQRVTPGAGVVETVITVEHSVGLQYRLTYHLDYAIDYPSAASLVHVQNAPSVAAWGQRVIIYPSWFRRGASDGAQARVDALAVPRQFVTLTLPLWQRDMARSAQVRDWQPGDYLACHVRDRATHTNVQAHCLIMAVRYDWRAGSIPKKVLFMLETGHPIVFNVFTFDRPNFAISARLG